MVGALTDGRTDAQNFRGYNIIPRHFLVAGDKNENFQIKISDILHISAQKHRLRVLVRTASARRF